MDEIFKPNKKTGISEWKYREELSKTDLRLTKNGNSRHGKFYNDNRYIWDKKIEKNTVIAIRTNGFDNISKKNRSIRSDIRKYYLNKSCVICGSTSNLVIDHKNDLYNNKRVLNIKTQKIEDFQCLCNHCNLQKREICKKEKKLKKIYSGKNIPTLKIFEFDFPWEKKDFDINDKYCKEDSYWYDPIEFNKKIYYYRLYKLPIIREIKRLYKHINQEV